MLPAPLRAIARKYAMCKFVYLCRHGESTWNCAGPEARAAPGDGLRDADLSPRGRAQVAALAPVLHDVSVVYSSPLTRTLRTAARLAELYRAPLRVSACLRERRRDIGDVGRSPSALATEFPALADELRGLRKNWWTWSCAACSRTRECGACEVRRTRQVRRLLTTAGPGAVVVSHFDVLEALSGRELANCETVRFTI